MGANSGLPNNALKKLGVDDGGEKCRPCVTSFPQEDFFFFACVCPTVDAQSLDLLERLCVFTSGHRAGRQWILGNVTPTHLSSSPSRDLETDWTENQLR